MEKQEFQLSEFAIKKYFKCINHSLGQTLKITKCRLHHFKHYKIIKTARIFSMLNSCASWDVKPRPACCCRTLLNKVFKLGRYTTLIKSLEYYRAV